MFLKNCWYVAGWSDNYKNELKPQKILGENIVFYRQKDGQAVALEDACPHRKLPLLSNSMSKIRRVAERKLRIKRAREN